jgi:hypothetical protein
VPDSCFPISQLSFADDVLIFTRGSNKALKVATGIFTDYEHVSGQLTNTQKSSFIMSSKVPLLVYLLFTGNLVSRERTSHSLILGVLNLKEG